MDKKKRKQARRLEARERRSEALPRPEGTEDPDIAHIKPGPQPLPPEFSDSREPEPDEEEEEES